jgi:hypothetical protein
MHLWFPDSSLHSVGEPQLRRERLRRYASIEAVPKLAGPYQNVTGGPVWRLIELQTSLNYDSKARCPVQHEDNGLVPQLQTPSDEGLAIQRQANPYLECPATAPSSTILPYTQLFQ